MAHRRLGRLGLPLLVTAVLVALLAASGCARKPVPPAPPSPPPSALDLIAQHGELRVCSTGDYRPFSYLAPAPDGRWSGIDVDMARDLAHALDARLTLVRTEWGRIADDVAAGRCDLAMGGISVELSRARIAAYSDPYLVDGKAAIVRCAQVTRFQGLAEIDRPGVRVVVNPRGSNETYDRATLKRASIVTYPDNNTIVDQLPRNRADVMITDASEVRWQVARHAGQLCPVGLDKPFTFEPKAYLLPRGDVVFQQWVNTWLRLTLGQGTYQRFSQAWLS